MEQSLVYYNDIVVHIKVKNSFLLLKQLMMESLGLSIDIVESIKTEQEIIRELIEVYKYKKELPIQDVDSADQSAYEVLRTTILNSHPNKYEPTLTTAKMSNRGDVMLYSIPNLPQVDPRTSGRLIRIGPKPVINPTVLRFMANNAGRHGFIHYGPYDPTIWYYRGDIEPYTYTPYEAVSYYNSELLYLL